MRKPTQPTRQQAPNAETDTINETSMDETKGENKDMQETVVLVNGMMCHNCEKHVKKALEKLDGIVDAAPDYTTGKVLVKHTAPLDEDAIKALIADADYEYVGLANA